ncbi:MAG: DUF3014 domain-containing protein [Pseudomonadales bacterium]|nr:DUF3014 domain-containing protein [Pseudomonadales bacterium]
MKKSVQSQSWLLTALLWLILIAVGVYYAWFRNTEDTQPVTNADSPEQVVPEPAPIRYPVELPSAETETTVAQTTETAPEPPLPKLVESDPRVLEILQETVGDEVLQPVLVPQHIISRIVTTIDNLTPAKLAINAVPLKPVPGKIKVEEKDKHLYLSAQNSQRYTPYIDLLDKANTTDIVRIYRKLYPLFQESYQELGNPSAYFNDRLIEVIDHLLAAPEPSYPIELVQPKVFFEYADPELEAASAGQKILFRIGPENAAKLKNKLREIRAELTAKHGYSE